MSNLKHWEDKIKQKRKNTDFREFVKEIASWIPIILNKNFGKLSRYPDTDRVFNLTDPIVYEESRDTFLNKWINYDFDKTFFENYLDLKKIMPLLSALVYENSENSNFAEGVWMSKNVYLSFIVISGCENILYTFYTQDNVKNTLNSLMVWDNSENVYFWAWIIKWFNVFYSKYICNSNNIWFSTNLVWCSECIFCDWLENQSYCINNKKLEKDLYFEEKNRILQIKHSFFDYYKNLNQNWMNLWSENIDWMFNTFSKNIKNWYFNYRLENWKNVVFVWDKDGRRNVMDSICSDQVWHWDIYACSNLWTSENVYCCDCIIWQSLYYCFDCLSCSFCLWCIWLKNKSYCILNKQYTKEEWYKKAEEIFSQMEKDWILWKFFPWELNPFYFNDTMAYLIDDSFTKEEVENQWYMWREEEIKVDIPEWVEVITIKDLNNYQWYDSNWNWQINPEILKKVIKDEKWNIYRIVQMEYDFLMKHWLPLPEIHWLDRIKMWFKFK